MRRSRLILALAIWSVFGIVCLISERAHGSEVYSEVTGQTGKLARPIPPGLAKVMAEGAGRVANMTCADVSAFVALYGARRAEVVARSAGATEHQIAVAKRCLK